MSITGDSFCTPNTVDAYFEDPPALITEPEAKSDSPDVLSPDLMDELLGIDRTRVSQAGIPVEEPPSESYAEGVARRGAQFANQLATAANITSDVRNAMAEVTARVNALQALNQYLNAANKDNLKATIDEIAQVGNFADSLISFMFPENAAPDDKIVQSLNDFNEAYLRPVQQWSNKMRDLFGNGSVTSRYIDKDGNIAIDLTGQDGSLDLLVGSVADALNAASLLNMPWASNAAGFLKAGLEIYKGVGQQLTAIDQAVQASMMMVTAAGSLVVAACEMAPALGLMLKNLYDNITAYWMGLLNEGIEPPFVLRNLTFKIPKLPSFLELKTYKGFGADLARIGKGFMDKCGGLVFPQNDVIANANINAFSDALGSLNRAQTALATGQAGIGNFTQGTSRSSNAWQKAFEEDPSMVETAPQRARISQEMASMMQSVGLGSPPATIADKPFAGASSLTPNQLLGFGAFDNGQPTGIPVVPTAEDHLRNKTSAAGDQINTAGAAQSVAGATMQAGQAGQTLGADATETAGKLALKAQLKSSSSLSLTTNQIMSDLKDPSTLTLAASDYYYCLAYAQQQGVSGAPNTVEGMEAEALKLFNTHAGLPNSFLSRVFAHRPVNSTTTRAYTAEEVFDTPEVASVPANWYQPAQASALAAYRNPFVTIGLDFENLPLLLLCKTTDDVIKLQSLINLFSLVKVIYENKTLYQSHKNVLIKANQQGVFGSSPYVWLGRLVEILDSLTSEPDAKRGRKLTYVELIWDFLSHNRYDLRSLFGWLGPTLEAIDIDAPTPTGLEGDMNDGYSEAYAAQQSYALIQSIGSPNFQDFIIFLRTNSDFLGGPIGFDYTLQTAVSIILKRVYEYLDFPTADEAAVDGFLAYAITYAEAMQNNKTQMEFIKAVKDKLS